MIDRIDISGTKGFDLDEDVKKYARKKIGKLDRYMPRSSAKNVHAEIKLMNTAQKSDKFAAEVILHFTGGQVNAKESAPNIYAAIDIVEQKVKNQLKKHHDKHSDHGSDRKGYLRKLRRLADRDFRGRQN
jgi:putative sigma-54 modulation protein